MPNDDYRPRHGSHFAPSSNSAGSAADSGATQRPQGARYAQQQPTYARQQPAAQQPRQRNQAYTDAGYSPQPAYQPAYQQGYRGGSSYHEPHRKKRRGGKIVAGIIGALVAIVLVTGGVCGVMLYRDARTITTQAHTMIDQAGTIKDAVMSGDGDTVRSVSTSIASQVSDIHSTTEGIPWKLASFIPVLGQDVQSARTMVAELDTLCQQALVPACDQLANLQLSNLFSDGAINVELIQSLASTLQTVAPVVQTSAETIDALPEAHISQLNDAMGQVKDLMGSASTALASINEMAPYLPQMLGANGQTRTYLLVAQSNAELRSTGGFPGSVGTLTITDGRITLGDFESIGSNSDSSMSRYDYPISAVTDEEINLFGERVGTIPADTNFIVDFSRAMTVLSEMWKDQIGGQVDGAIAVDPVFLQNLLTLTGGINTSYGTSVDGTNAAAILLHNSYLMFDAQTQDAFYTQVASAAFNQLTSNLGNVDPMTLVDTITNAMDEHRFQVWMVNGDEENVMKKIGCSGTLSTDPATPQVGVYINDDTYSKISWYLSTHTTINTSQLNADGSTTYNLTTTIKNNITPAVAESDGAQSKGYIVGSNSLKRDVTDMINQVYLVAPAGGTISDVVVNDAAQGGSPLPYEGFQVYHVQTQTSGGATTSITYNVTTAATATADLTIEQTPTAQAVAGWE